MKKFKTEDYKQWIAQNRPEYELCEGEVYVNCSTKLRHRHISSGVEWECTPDKFKSGVSAPGIKRKTPNIRSTEDYKQWIAQNRPEYECLQSYVNVKTKLRHRHIPTGVEWDCTPEKFMKGHKPTQLTNCERISHEQYVEYITNNQILIEPVEEVSNRNKQVLHRCLTTNELFYVCPDRVLKNPDYQYTPQIVDTDSYKNWLEINRPDLVVTESYKGSHTKINHMHVETGACWMVKPNNVQQGQHHPAEQLNSASYKCIEWLNSIDRDIQHVLNGGEVTLPGIGKVDGFDNKTNTVYEFHGDFWHGNPEVFSQDDINPVTETTFGQLYEHTTFREQLIKDYGYNLVVMWEADFNNLMERA